MYLQLLPWLLCYQLFLANPELHTDKHESCKYNACNANIGISTFKLLKQLIILTGNPLGPFSPDTPGRPASPYKPKPKHTPLALLWFAGDILLFKLVNSTNVSARNTPFHHPGLESHPSHLDLASPTI